MTLQSFVWISENREAIMFYRSSPYTLIYLPVLVSDFQGILEGGSRIGLPDYPGGPPRRISGFAGCVQSITSSLSISLFSSLFIYFLIFKLSSVLFISILRLFLPCRGSQPIITSTTVEVVVPRALVPVICGEDGECLKQILQVNPLHLIIINVNFVDFIYGQTQRDNVLLYLAVR